jgi:catecholate siderophore receptor
VTAGLNQPVNRKVALRIDGLFEDSGSFRDFVGLTRRGVTPALTVAASDRTRVTLRYEFLGDSRVADRGITSFQGRPADVATSTFFGNPGLSDVAATVNHASGLIEHRMGRLTLRNRTVVANYDRSYQNFVPGPVDAARTQVTLTSYNNATNRTNGFNQTDATLQLSSGRIRHTLLGGVEFGRQATNNFRNTGYFNNTATSVLAPLTNPTISTPVTYRQSVTDADNHVTATVAAAYVQDQVDLSRYLQVVGGVRFDRFDLDYHNNRTSETLDRRDDLVSPRAGIVFKPVVPLSFYGSYSASPELGRPVRLPDRHHRTGQARAVPQLRGGGQVGCGARPGSHDGRLPLEPDQHSFSGSERSDTHRADR